MMAMKETDVVTVSILREILNETFGEFSDRFKAIGDRFNSMDKRFDGIDKRFDAIDKRFDSMDKRFDGIDSRLNGIDNRVDENFDMLNDKINKVKGGLDFTIRFEANRLHRRIDQVDRSSKRRDDGLLKQVGGTGSAESEWSGGADDKDDEGIGEPVRV
ncbi:MAG: hypothetical protein Q8L64_05300 [bacterium]|nr:hypothetical protein [bacterium]